VAIENYIMSISSINLQKITKRTIINYTLISKIKSYLRGIIMNLKEIYAEIWVIFQCYATLKKGEMQLKQLIIFSTTEHS